MFNPLRSIYQASEKPDQIAPEFAVADGGGAGATGGGRRAARGATSERSALWEAIMALKRTVEEEHDHRLRRIETDLRWVMALLGAQFATIIGAAITVLVTG